jgi:hypothetical protein
LSFSSGTTPPTQVVVADQRPVCAEVMAGMSVHGPMVAGALVMDIIYSYTLLSSWNGEYVSVNLFAHADEYVV